MAGNVGDKNKNKRKKRRREEKSKRKRREKKEGKKGGTRHSCVNEEQLGSHFAWRKSGTKRKKKEEGKKRLAGIPSKLGGRERTAASGRADGLTAGPRVVGEMKSRTVHAGNRAIK